MPEQGIFLQNVLNLGGLCPIRNEPYPTLLPEFHLWPNRLPSFHQYV